MAYTPIKLDAWIAANPDYGKYAGTASGAPFMYQAAKDEPSLTPESWNVFDHVTGTPDLSQAPAEADITPTGKTVRVLIPTVPDAPSASDLVVPLGSDTDAKIEALEGLEAAYQAALANGDTFFVSYFLGEGKRSHIFAAAVAWSGTMNEVEFPEPWETTITITPNLGLYSEWKTIGSAVSG